MSSLDFECNDEMANLERDWRVAHEASIIARAEFRALIANPVANVGTIEIARDRLYRAEALKLRIFEKIERLECSVFDIS
jgi:hypothetical protein